MEQQCLVWSVVLCLETANKELIIFCVCICHSLLWIEALSQPAGIELQGNKRPAGLSCTGGKGSNEEKRYMEMSATSETAAQDADVTVSHTAKRWHFGDYWVQKMSADDEIGINK